MNGIQTAMVFPRAMKNQIKTILLLGVLSAILIGFGAMLGRQWVVGSTLLALVLNLGASFFSDILVSTIAAAVAGAIAYIANMLNPFAGMRGMVKLFSTHPPMQERVRRLRGMQFVRYAT
ncbi:MAG: hypothetical protein ACXW5U_02285 [Thermoanaerobaculia bacterium]